VVKSSSPADNPSRLYLLDILRGLLAFAVMVYHFYLGNGLASHLGNWVPGFVDGLIAHCQVGLELFFVLSGFVIALTLPREPVNARSAAAFILRRQIRLDPPYWAALGLMLALGLLSSLLVPSHRHLVFPSLKDLLLNMFYLQGIAGQDPLLMVAWTLCLEVQFYLLFILLLWVGTLLKLNRPMQVLLSLPLFVWCICVFYGWLPTPQAYPTIFPALLVPFWAMFYTGVLACWAWEDRRLQPIFWGHLLLFTVPGLLAYRVDVLLRLLACTAVMVAALRGWLPWGARCRPLLVLAALSYSLYLVHVPIGGRVINLLLRVSHSPLACVLWLVLAVVASLAVAWILHHLVEVPSAQLGRRLKKRVVDAAPPPQPPAPPPPAPALPARKPAVLARR